MMILIKNGTILTQDKNRRVIKDGAVLFEGETIKAIGQTKKVESLIKGKKLEKIIEAKGKVVMPGLVNAHTHLAMTLLRGLADDLPLEEWWFKKIFSAESKFTRRHVFLGSLLGGLEMIKSGTTCFVDFYYFEDEVASAVKELGLRANLGVGILDLETFAFKNSPESFVQFFELAERFRNDNLIRISLAPHMFQTTSRETYKKAKKAAGRFNCIMQTHLAETKAEVDFCRKKYGKTPAQILDKEKILDGKTLLAHGCHLDEKDIKILGKNKVSVAHCPVSNMKLASGVMPLARLEKAGVCLALGTDGSCSNNSLDMFGEMKFAALLQKSFFGDPALADSQRVLDMATINGARALGLEKEIGSIEPGKKADIIILDFDQPHLTPVSNIASHLVYCANGADVLTSIVNGRVVMENRKVKVIDEKKVLVQIKEILKLNS
ncbi:MAG: amidohydrolase [Candidatus Portnoybacteria bacterium]|nr:amidohydrolase [Candidatus Portnoybacteria bacterium]